MHHVYALKDPRNNHVEYIGITTNPVMRLSKHIGRPNNKMMVEWIGELSAIGLRPTMDILDKTNNKKRALEIENSMIFVFGQLGERNGDDLLNGWSTRKRPYGTSFKFPVERSGQTEWLAWDEYWQP